MSYRNNRSRSGSKPYNRSGNRGRSSGFSQRPVELHKVTCSKCGEETEVPFKPDGSRPVYCRECYQQQRPRRY